MRLTSPEEVASRLGSLMEGFEAPWCVAGGWALDLFLGRATRDHGDVELAVFRQDQSLIHSQFPGWTLTVSINGRREPWKPTNRLELPVHEIHAYSPDEPPEGIELLLNERDRRIGCSGGILALPRPLNSPFSRASSAYRC